MGQHFHVHLFAQFQVPELIKDSILRVFRFFLLQYASDYFLEGLLAVLTQGFFYLAGLWAPERVQMIGLRAFVLRLLLPGLLVPVEPPFVPVVEVVELLRGAVARGEEEGVVPGVIVGDEGFSDRSSQEDEPEGEGLVAVAGHEGDEHGSVGGSDEVEDGKLGGGLVLSHDPLLAVAVVVPDQEADPAPGSQVVLQTHDGGLVYLEEQSVVEVCVLYVPEGGLLPEQPY